MRNHTILMDVFCSILPLLCNLLLAINWVVGIPRPWDFCQPNEVFVPCGECEGTCKLPVIVRSFEILIEKIPFIILIFVITN